MKKNCFWALKYREKQIVTIVAGLVLVILCTVAFSSLGLGDDNSNTMNSILTKCPNLTLSQIQNHDEATMSSSRQPGLTFSRAPVVAQVSFPSAGQLDLEDNSPYLGKRSAFTESEQIIRDAIAHLESFRSISAEIRLQINLFGDTWKGTGKYEELIARTRPRKSSLPSHLEHEKSGDNKGEKLSYLSPLEWTQFRLHVKILPSNAHVEQTGRRDNTLEIVCDRHALWTYTLIEGSEKLTQLNLEDLANSLNRLSEERKKELFDSGVERPCGTSGLPGLGGLAGLLKRLLVDYSFRLPPDDIQSQKGKSAAWVVTGVLKRKKFESYKDFFLGNPSNNRFDLLETIPTHVVLYIGKQSPFPYRILYFNSMDRDKNESRYPSAKNNNPTPIFSIDYGPVLENPSFLQPKNFVYGPPALNFERINDVWLQSMIPGIKL